MFKKIVVALFIAYVGLEAYQAPQEMKYFININKQFKGVLLFNNSDKSTKVKYYNITSRDKIPFYAPSKEFAFTSLNKMPTLKSLDVSKYAKHMVYDVAKLSQDEIEEADINSADIADSAIIYNKDDLPSEVVEKRNIHTIESLMLSIFETNRVPLEAFYLYEPQKKMLIKVKFSKEKREKIRLEDLSCETQTYVLSIVGRDKRLIRVYINKYPLKIESFKKRWSFTLAGSGESKEVIISNKEIAYKVFKDEILDKYRDYNVKILSQNVETNIFGKKYITKYYVSKELNKKELNKSLKKYTDGTLNIEYVKNSRDAFVFSVDNDEIEELLKKKYNIEDGKYFWKSEPTSIKAIVLLKWSADKHRCEIANPLMNDSILVCSGKEKHVDYEETLEEYYKKKYRDFKISKVKEVKDDFRKIRTVEFTLKSLRKIDNTLMKSFAVKAIQKKYPKNHFSNRLHFEKSENKWSLYISKKAVSDYACSKAIPSLRSEYKDGKCQKVAQSVHTQEDTKNLVTKFIDRNYKDMKILDTKINEANDNVSFEYLELSKKVKNVCK